MVLHLLIANTNLGNIKMDYMELQRRNFESQFGSLESLGYKDKSVEAEGGSGSGSDSSESDEMSFGFGSDKSGSENESSESEGESGGESDGLFDSESDSEAPKVVRLTDTSVPVMVSKADKKLARAGRAPTLEEMEAKQRALSKLTRKQQLRAAQEDSENVENDLKLQRLLSESHILAHNLEYSGADLTMQTLDYEAPIGNSRRRILEQRIRSAAATNSSTAGLPKKLEKMPMHMRKGMIRAREQRVADHEREAREAGIVLSRVKKGELRNLDQGRGATSSSDRLGVGKKQAARMRDRGLRINSVGKATRNGLRISQDEIDRITNQGKRRGGKGGRGGRGGKGGKRR